MSDIISNIVIPLVAAFIGGGMTLAGVLITITHENKKAKKEYLERIRPYLVVESVKRMVESKKEYVSIFLTDDSEGDEKSKTIFHWNSLLLTNVSETVCVINYAKINGKRYNVYEKNPLKVGETCEIRGYPLSCYMRAEQIKDISIGILDKQFNQYEYAISFDVMECEEKSMEKLKNAQKEIVFSILDCSKNLF